MNGVNFNLLRSIAMLAAMSMVGRIVADEHINQDKNATILPRLLSTEQLTANIRPSLVTIRVRDRDGDELGLGTGFVVDAQGLIATNMHVISEGRPLTVELWPNTPLKVLAIEATSRGDDLAIIRVSTDEQKLIPIPLGDGEIVAQGVEVLAFGNPLGLKHSVVQGVVSATREIESQEMIQVAMPIEPGNSGGPLIDRTGAVRGIVNMKSLQAQNVGFAIPVARLKRLLEATNPIPFERWVRLAGIDEEVWRPLMGAQWRERSGIISVSEAGKGFGGRALCLNSAAVPKEAFEVAVQVKLDDEAGAAGLVFHADGADRHYGFYPSGGRLRLTCFQGPSVYSWEVIHDVASRFYSPGQWNHLKVSVRNEKIRCFVNGHLVIETMHHELTDGQVGLAKFRNTHAEFRGFQLAPEIANDQLSEAGEAWFTRLPTLADFSQSTDSEAIEILSPSDQASSRELLYRAQMLEQQSERLRRLADDVRISPILKQLKELFKADADDALLSGALLIAALDHPDMDLDVYRRRVDSMAEEIKEQLPPDQTDEQKLAALDHYLFEENGFHGCRDEYYHEANNHLDRVIDDREGMPIALTLLYMELARRLDLTVEGVGLPGHFVARFRAADDNTQLVDVFEKARRMSDDEAAQLIAVNLQRLPRDADFRAQQPNEILVRMLHNLVSSAERARDMEAIRRYTEGLVALKDDVPEYRLRRAAIRYQTARLAESAEDLEWLLDNAAADVDLERIRDMRDQITLERNQAP